MRALHYTAKGWIQVFLNELCFILSFLSIFNWKIQMLVCSSITLFALLSAFLPVALCVVANI